MMDLRPEPSYRRGYDSRRGGDDEENDREPSSRRAGRGQTIADLRTEE